MRKTLLSTLFAIFLPIFDAIPTQIPTVNYVNNYFRTYCGNKNITTNANPNHISSQKYVLDLIDSLNVDTTYGATANPQSVITTNYLNAATELLHGGPMCNISEMCTTARDKEYAYSPNTEYVLMQTKMPAKLSWQYSAYGNGRFVSVARGSQTAAYSDDGYHWQSTSMPSNEYWSAVTWCRDKFVAVSGKWWNSNKAAYSYDGITWHPTTIPFSAPWISVACDNDGHAVATSANDNQIAYSPDGITWESTTSVPSLNRDGRLNGVTWGDGKFVAIGKNQTYSIHSYDGKTWEIGGTIPSNTDWYNITYGDGKFIAISTNVSSIGRMITSTDGISWTQQTAPNTSIGHSALIYTDNGFILNTQNASKILYFSPNGETWTKTTIPFSGDMFAMAHGKNTFFVSAYGSNLALYGQYKMPWAVGYDCTDATDETNIANMCDTVLVGGYAACQESTCTCQRTKINQNGTLTDEIGDFVTVHKYESHDTCKSQCPQLCARSVTQNENNMCNPIMKDI